MLKPILALVLAIFLKYEPGVECATMGPQNGPIGNIDLNNVGHCPYKDTLKTKLNVELTKQGKEKIITGSFSLPFDFDASITYKIFMHKWTGSEWKKNVFKLDGKLCEHSDKYAKSLLSKFFGSLQPKVSGKCNAKKGDYKINKFQGIPKDVTLPSIFYGKLKVELHLYKGKDEIACVVGEGDSKPPK